MCEKPFVNASGDGRSLAFFVNPTFNTKSLALELPFIVVREHFRRVRDLWQRLLHARNLRFIWFTGGRGNRIIEDLALHPWSLLPVPLQVTEALVKDQGNTASVVSQCVLHDRPIRVEMSLAYGGNFTGLEIDGYAVGIRRDGPRNTIMHIPGALDDAAKRGNDELDGQVLCSVPDPITPHFRAALSGRPLVGWDTIRKSQLFLERLRGYAGTGPLPCPAESPGSNSNPARNEDR